MEARDQLPEIYWTIGTRNINNGLSVYVVWDIGNIFIHNCFLCC